MTRPESFLVAALALAMLAPAAQADQLQIIEPKAAQKAAKVLAPGSLFVDWISHMGDSKPTLYRVESVQVLPWDADPTQSELKLSARKLGQATRGPNAFETPFDWQLRQGAEPEQVIADLAYIYVPSREVPGMFVVLGKALRQPCEVDSIAIELPARVLEEASKPQQASASNQTNQGRAGPRDQSLGGAPDGQGLVGGLEQAGAAGDQAGPNTGAQQVRPGTAANQAGSNQAGSTNVDGANGQQDRPLDQTSPSTNGQQTSPAGGQGGPVGALGEPTGGQQTSPSTSGQQAAPRGQQRR